MPRRDVGYTLCTCSKCRAKDPNGVGLVISAKECAMHKATERMGVPLPANRVTHLTSAISDLKLGERGQQPVLGARPLHLSKSLDPINALEAAFSEMAVETGNEPPHLVTDTEPKPYFAYRMTCIPMRPSGKRDRSTRGRVEVALKVLRSIQNETSALHSQVQDASEGRLSFELLVRVAMRLETFRIALDKTNRNESDVLSLKRVVIDEVDSLERLCNGLRESVPCLAETGPVKFCSGKNAVCSTSQSLLITDLLKMITSNRWQRSSMSLHRLPCCWVSSALSWRGSVEGLAILFSAH